MGVLQDCSGGTTKFLPCNDNNNNTIQDSVLVLVCDESICVPCIGKLIDCNTTGLLASRVCDDQDPCTINDVEWLLPNGVICVPCLGVLSECANADTLCLSAVPCDDNNPNTINDTETILTSTGDICLPCKGTSQTFEVLLPSIINPGNSANATASVFTTGIPRLVIKYTIYDRWGNVMYQAKNFSSNDRSIGWNGNFNGKNADSGVYMYIVEIEGIDRPFTGTITLIR